MNQVLIKQLAKLAGAHYHPGMNMTRNQVWFWDDEYEKLVKNIVDECAKFTDNQEELYKHFGIEK